MLTRILKLHYLGVTIAHPYDMVISALSGFLKIDASKTVESETDSGLPVIVYFNEDNTQLFKIFKSSKKENIEKELILGWNYDELFESMAEYHREYDKIRPHIFVLSELILKNCVEFDEIFFIKSVGYGN